MPDIFVDESQDQPVPEKEPSPPLSEQPKQSPEPPPQAPVTQVSQSSETLPQQTTPRWSDQHKELITLLREPEGKPGMFSSFVVKPQGVSFEDQEPGEEILLLVRRDFATNIPWIFLAITMIFIPLLILPVFQSDEVTALTANFPGTFTFVTLCLYYLIIVGFVLQQFTTWFYQVGVITNIRVIDVDFNTLLARNIAYTDITDIVDTEAHQRGLMQGLFNFGNVGLQTAGMKANFEFSSIPQPNKVVDIISDLMRNRKGHGHE